MLYENTSVHARAWNHIQRPDGRTLELEPGESAELDLPEDFSDLYLKPVAPAPKGRKGATEPTEPAEQAASTEE